MRTQRQQVRVFGDKRKLGSPKHLDWHRSLEAGEVKVHALRKAREIGDYQHALVLELPYECQHLAIAGVEKLEAAAAEGAKLLALLDQPFGPPQQRVRVVLLSFDVDRFVVILRIDVDRQIEALRVGARESGVAVRAPLHRRAYAVAVAEKNIIAHPNLVAVIEDGRAG